MWKWGRGRERRWRGWCEAVALLCYACSGLDGSGLLHDSQVTVALQEEGSWPWRATSGGKEELGKISSEPEHIVC